MFEFRAELFQGDELLQAIANDESEPDGAPVRITRRRNAKGDSVTRVQTALLTWRPGVLPRHGADGVYGDETANAVKAFKVDELEVPAAKVADDVGPRTVQTLDGLQAAAEEAGSPEPPDSQEPPAPTPTEMTDLPRFEDFFSDNRDLFDHSPEAVDAVHAATAEAEKAGLVKVPSPAPGPVKTFLTVPLAAVSHTQFQTPFKSQTQRGTCYAFAAVAAMEAAYRRQHGTTLDLSEQYAFHINKVTELLDDYQTSNRPYENNSSMWGFQGSSDIVDKLARAAIPDEAACPYLNDTQMQQLLASTPGTGGLTTSISGQETQEQLDAFEFSEGHIPTASRRRARYQVKSYAALPANPTPQQIEAVLAAGYEVVADIPGHCVLIVGYDRNQQRFIIKDSANASGFQTLDYNSATIPILAGRYITAVHPPNTNPQTEAWWLGRWSMDHDGWRGELVIRRTTNFRRPAPGRPTKLGSYYRDGKRRDVNGEVLENGRGLHFWIADTTAKATPGSKSGQEFWAYVFSHDPDNAAGRTTWENIPFGVSLRRGRLTGERADGFRAQDWLGVWEMNHDGWRGQLRVDSVNPLRGSYHAPQENKTFPIRGELAGHDHVLKLTIEGMQDFQLFAHTWEKGVLSGITWWNKMTFGVQARKVDRR